MTNDQFNKLVDLIEANSAHMDLLSRIVTGLIERERSPDCEPPGLISSQDDINAVLESLKATQYAKTVALKFLKNP
jgi:hypothetical protein